tara:strand:- start:545 stop:901 length:357 start_codon:yes stop_codon:yes gene_type:complete
MILYICILLLLLFLNITLKENVANISAETPLNLVKRINNAISIAANTLPPKVDTPVSISMHLQSLPIRGKKEGLRPLGLSEPMKISNHLDKISNKLEQIQHRGDKNHKVNLQIQKISI